MSKIKQYIADTYGEDADLETILFEEGACDGRE